MVRCRGAAPGTDFLAVSPARAPGMLPGMLPEVLTENAPPPESLKLGYRGERTGGARPELEPGAAWRTAKKAPPQRRGRNKGLRGVVPPGNMTRLLRGPAQTRAKPVAILIKDMWTAPRLNNRLGPLPALCNHICYFCYDHVVFHSIKRSRSFRLLYVAIAPLASCIARGVPWRGGLRRRCPKADGRGPPGPAASRLSKDTNGLKLLQTNQ